MKKHTLSPEITLLNQFYAQKGLFKVPKICDINFWIENDPPPLALFKKFIDLVAGSSPFLLFLLVLVLDEIGDVEAASARW